MDLATTDQRAWALAPHLVVVEVEAEATVAWVNPETGTSCQLEQTGEYVVLRRTEQRLTPVVAGQILPDEAARVRREPESELSRRAAAHAIVAVDAS